MFSSNRQTTTRLTCGFKVNTSSPEWHKSMTKILKKITGGNFWIDVDEGMAYVTGQGDPNKLLKLMGSKRGKDAEMVFVKTGSTQHPQGSFYGQSTPYWPSSDMSYMQPSSSQGFYPQDRRCNLTNINIHFPAGIITTVIIKVVVSFFI